MGDLRDRAQRFLERPYPLGNYVEDNLTDGFIRRYIEGGPWDDCELEELLRFCYAEAQTQAEFNQGAGREYYQECAEILCAILTEIYESEASK